MRVDPDTLGRRDAHQLMIGAIVPRPIAWISSVSKRGEVNLAPFSLFNGVTADPPMISVSINARRGEMKDTLSNILETKEFVVNVVEDAAGEAMVATSADFPPEVNEFEACGVEPTASEMVAPPRVKDAPVSMECHYEQLYQFGYGPTHMVVARVRSRGLRAYPLTSAAACRASSVSALRDMRRRATQPKRSGGDRRRL